ncbi:hypothetical protein E2C01_102035 [Portunus trituberculatus]|uniref:CCHC-type domain-containing protein n=1 Tax=Portunus trituberculatus TaxID=210409 RepID=A0A5B7KN99_PORTR|nr:hypothetical protein [Portunus trituberculatus]
MVLLTFFGSTLPDRVYIGPINLRVRRFISRPLQCFSCYGYGHGKRSCKEASRCGNCLALDSHSEEHCNTAVYCFHYRDAHQQSKISPGAHDRESSRNRSAMVAPTVSVQPSETPSVSDRASCEDGLSMEMTDDIITAAPRGPTVAKSAVQPDPRPPVTGRNGDNSHHSPVGRKAAVQRPSTSQLPVSSRRLTPCIMLGSAWLRVHFGHLQYLAY